MNSIFTHINKIFRSINPLKLLIFLNAIFGKIQTSESPFSVHNAGTTRIAHFRNHARPGHISKQERNIHCYSEQGVLGICSKEEDCFPTSKIFGRCSNTAHNGNLMCCGIYDVYDRTGVQYECGTPSKIFARKGKVVNGTVAHYAEFPWQAYITAASSRRSFCGGALLNDQWVITAAHCVFRYSTNAIIVILGAFDFLDNEEPYPIAERRIANKIIHENFNYKGEFDLALLQLKHKVSYQPNIIPICLPGQSFNFEGTMGIVTGWGRTGWNSPVSNILRKVSLPILSEKECVDNLNYYHDSFLCAGYKSGGSDSCSGDSGGPLQVQTSNKRFYLAGIVSSGGAKCAEKGVIGIYSKISLSTHWIKKWTGIS